MYTANYFYDASKHNSRPTTATATASISRPTAAKTSHFYMKMILVIENAAYIVIFEATAMSFKKPVIYSKFVEYSMYVCTLQV